MDTHVSDCLRSYNSNYKCLNKKTWPNPKSGKAKDNVGVILKELNYENDVRYGTSKVFIKSPQTVFGLESKRSERIPQIVIYLQKVNIFNLKSNS